ncbi:MAG: hypothetical protein HYR75_03070 [Gemmatimonadetes bacterium]|nr:hypothetical protein [Gemmatimonadota bacterium]MBI3567248.1 hypothetical protein [Gemmatimonadota bacterium]
MSPRVIAWALLAAAWRAVGAQSPQDVQLDAGYARVQQRARDERGAGILGVTWRVSDLRVSSLLSAALTNTGDSLAAGQILGAIAMRPTSARWAVLEAGAGLNIFGITNSGRGGNFSGYLRPRVSFGDGGAWVGVSDGSTVRDGNPSHGTTVEAGGWYRLGDVTATASFSRLRTDDWPLLEAAGIYLSRPALMADMDDATVGLHYARGRFTADLANSWREGRRASPVSQEALLWSASWAFTDRVALALSGGRMLADPVRGTPDASLTMAVLRFTWRPKESEADVPGVASYARVAPQAGGAMLLLAIVAPSSVAVDVAGDFSNWEPTPLVRTPNGWEFQTFLKPGRHRVAVRYDGGPWRAPGNLARMKDEFDGEYGLIIVP